jgi:hypothetical protein
MVHGLDQPAVAVQVERRTTGIEVSHDHWVRWIQAEEADDRGPLRHCRPGRHTRAERVIRVEQERSATADPLGHQGLDLGQICDVGDPVGPDVVASDVGHDRDVGPVIPETSARDPASSGLQNGHFGRRVAEHHLRRGGPDASAS